MEIEKILENINIVCKECKLAWKEAMTGPNSQFNEANRTVSEARYRAVQFAKILQSKEYKKDEVQTFIGYHTTSPRGTPDNCDKIRKKIGLSELLPGM